MGTVIKELVQRGHDQAAELKSSCGAIDVRSVAQLISDLASHLDVQLARSNALAAENTGLKSAKEIIRHLNANREEANFCGIDDCYIDDAVAAMITPATDDFLAEIRAQGVEMFADKYRAQLTALPTTSENIFDAAHVSLRYQIFDADEFAAQLRKGVAQ
ncbi:hypothetical protein FNH48_13590 [Salmonella enterica subsp. salamae]|nr:hypothetical protein [Salmonella enterica subsp. salamae]